MEDWRYEDGSEMEWCMWAEEGNVYGFFSLYLSSSSEEEDDV